MGIVSTEQEQHNRYAEEELLRRRVLSTIVDLLPHVEVVEGATVEFKGHSAYVVEHDV